jgi:16S rRNA G966 N2-methylase RsmD
VQKNQLYYGDNLGVLREHIKDESVDLIYLDPPFNSRQDYNVLFAEKDGTRSSSRSWPSRTPGSGTSMPRPRLWKS